MSFRETEQLGKLMHRKLQVVSKLLDLTRQQAQWVEESEMTSLLEVLGEKQKLLSDLGILEKRLLPYRDQDPASRKWKSEAEREDCRKRIQACEQMIAEVIALENGSQKSLIEKRDRTYHQLQKLDQGSRVHGAYSQQMHMPSGKSPNAFQESPRLDLSAE